MREHRFELLEGNRDCGVRLATEDEALVRPIQLFVGLVSLALKPFILYPLGGVLILVLTVIPLAEKAVLLYHVQELVESLDLEQSILGTAQSAVEPARVQEHFDLGLLVLPIFVAEAVRNLASRLVVFLIHRGWPGNLNRIFRIVLLDHALLNCVQGRELVLYVVEVGTSKPLLRLDITLEVLFFTLGRLRASRRLSLQGVFIGRLFRRWWSRDLLVLRWRVLLNAHGARARLSHALAAGLTIGAIFVHSDILRAVIGIFRSPFASSLLSLFVATA